MGSGVTVADAGGLATVSRILNNIPGQASPATRRRDLRAVRDPDYGPKALARSLHQRRTQTAGLLLRDITHPYSPEIARGIADAVSQQGCRAARKAGRRMT